MKKNKIIVLMIIVIMASIGSVKTAFAQGERTTEPVNSADIKLRVVPWRSQYFQSFDMEDIKNDSIPFFVGDKFYIRLGQFRSFTEKGVVAIDSIDIVKRCTRLKFVKRTPYGIKVQLPSGRQITYKFTSGNRYVYGSGSNQSFLMWCVGHKRQNFEEPKTEAEE
jgi:hypothetical protein